MNQAQMESLKYPMFTTTPEEKLILEKVLSTEFETFFLCIKLRGLGAPLTLRMKVRDSIKDECALEYYLFGGVEAYESLPTDIKDFYNTYDNANELRNIWIRKLLAYKGE